METFNEGVGNSIIILYVAIGMRLPRLFEPRNDVASFDSNVFQVYNLLCLGCKKSSGKSSTVKEGLCKIHLNLNFYLLGFF